jgi:hypothetical protein
MPTVPPEPKIASSNEDQFDKASEGDKDDAVDSGIL